MNRKQNIDYIPKTGFVISITVLVGLVIVGIYMGNSWICNSISIFGTTSSCTEAILTSPYGLVAIAALVFSGAWLVAIHQTKKSSKSIQNKKK